MAWADASSVVKRLLTEVPTDTRIRTLQAVVSASEKNNLITVNDLGYGAGKKRNLNLVYFAPNCAPTSCSTNICDGTAVEPSVAPFTISECASSSVVKLDMDHMRLVDGSFGWTEYGLTILKAQMNEIRTNLNASLASKLVTMVGTFADGAASKKIAYVDPTTGSINARGYFEIERAVQDVGLTNPYIVGGQDVFAWEKGVLIGGLNQHGQRIDQLPYGNAYYDTVLENAFGGNNAGHILAFAANAIKFVTFSKNAGQFGNAVPTTQAGFDKLNSMFRAADTYLYGSVIDPMTGLIYDLTIEKDACSPSFNMRLSIDWDLFNMPQTLCNTAGVTGLFHFTTCLPVELPCPSPAVPNPQNSIYSAVADDLPVAITGVIVGGTTYPITGSPANAVELAALLTSAIPGYSFSGNNTAKTVSYLGYGGISVAVVANPTSDNFTLSFTNS